MGTDELESRPTPRFFKLPDLACTCIHISHYLPSLVYIHDSHDSRPDRVVRLYRLPRLSCPSADHTCWANQDGNMRHQSIAVPQYATMHSLHAALLRLISVKYFECHTN